MNIDEIKLAAENIKLGKLVAFPTETVYGLGADATNEEACKKIFAIKNRPNINPLIVHVASLDQAESLGQFNDDTVLLSKLWPGPLTIIMNLKPSSNIAKSVLAGLTTIALRIPAHPIAIELIKRAECPIAAPSANPSGYISPTSAQHVLNHFAKDDNLFVLHGNNSEYGLESTIIDITTEIPTILRYGFITPSTLESILRKKIAVYNKLSSIKAPGMLDKHYSPRVQVRLNAKHLEEGEIGLNFGNSNLHGNYSLNLSSSGNLTESASNLYSMLRKLDDYAILHHALRIAIAPIPNQGVGLAINDRLVRACQ
jgi:L-threonylcarbamoyladenylate synthase